MVALLFLLVVVLVVLLEGWIAVAVDSVVAGWFC